MKQRVWLILAVLSLSGCVSVEMPEHMVSDSVNAAKDAYHSIAGDKTEPAAKEKGEGAASPSAEDSAGSTPTPTTSGAVPGQTGEYEYIYVGDEGVSLKEAKATCFKNASLLARRASGKTQTDPRLVAEKAELEGDTIVVTCRVASE